MDNIIYKILFEGSDVICNFRLFEGEEELFSLSFGDELCEIWKSADESYLNMVKIKKGSVFGDGEVYREWNIISVDSEHQEFLEKIFHAFIKKYMGTYDKEKIKEFKEHIKLY